MMCACFIDWQNAFDSLMDQTGTDRKWNWYWLARQKIE